MKIKVGISNRHAHLTKADCERLGVDPKPEKWLGIADNFASDTCLQGPNGLTFRVLLPLRKYSQIEMLASDAKRLGIKPCYRFSGQLDGAPTISINGVDIPAIVALPHVHVPNTWAKGRATVRIKGIKDIVLRNVALWPTPADPNDELPVLHIDKDEATAMAVDGDTEVRLDTFTLVGTNRGFTFTNYNPYVPVWCTDGNFTL